MKPTITLTLAAAAIMAAPVAARQLTPAEALENVMKSETSMQRRVGALSQNSINPVPVYTARADASLNTVYVFNRRQAGSGFVVVAADDVATPLLGYSDTGEVDPANMPPSLVSWLAGYSDEIARAAAQSQRPARYITRRADRAPIAPMTTTTWNQSAPYNNMCPEVSGTRCVTGCVATATAQVMKYHNWPVTGVGTSSYSWNNTTLSFNYGSTTFDWDDMIDNYTSSATTAQNNAVATLMYAVGVASQMDYGTDESGTSIYYAAEGLVDHFNYDKGLKVVDREYFPLSTWIDMVYDELAAGRVVEYAGQSSAGGHCFVCDGYSADNYFHFNWGWGGMSDGYYLLTALDPTSQGIGGSGAGFNEGQSIILGLQKPTGNNTLAATVITQGNFATTGSTYSSSSNVTFEPTGASQNAFFSMSLGSLDFTFGVKLTAEDGTVSYAAGTRAVSLAMMQGIGSYNVPASAFPESGTYTVTPAVRVNGTWSDILVQLGNVRSLKMTADDGTLTFTSIPVDINLSATDLSISSPLYSGADCQIKANITNNGSDEYYGQLIPVLMTISGTEAQEVAEGATQTVDILGGQTEAMEAIVNFTVSTPGTYYFGLVTSAGEIIGDPVEVTVEQTPTGTSSISATQPVASTTAGTGTTSADPAVVSPADAQFSYTLTVNSGYISGSVGAYIFYDNSTAVQMFGTQFVSLSAGQSATIDMEGSLTGLDENHVYMMVPWDFSDSKQLGYPSYFKVTDSTTGTIEAAGQKDFSIFPTLVDATATVTAPAAITAVEVYSTAGANVATVNGDGTADTLTLDVADIVPGIYIVKIATPDAVKTIRIIKE
ncbi:MAG: thiol protease/hemagglutinin PrtT [Muribaculaceae bacterium]|nr:thiol protease/hemagglutinin PrtT [Muribaculaceae bacterium]